MRLFIKITLIAPAKKSVITNIKKSDIKEGYKKLFINGIDVNVPCGLAIKEEIRDLIVLIR